MAKKYTLPDFNYFWPEFSIYLADKWKKDLAESLQANANFINECTDLEYLLANPPDGFLHDLITEMQQKDGRQAYGCMFPYLIWIARYNKISAFNDNLFTVLNASKQVFPWSNEIFNEAPFLFIAVAFDSRDIIKDAFKRKLFNERDIKSSLILAMQEGNVEKFQFIVDHAFSNDLLKLNCDISQYPLFFAIENNQVDFIRLLYRQEYKINVETGMSYLHIAVLHAYQTHEYKAVKVLLQLGADTNYKWNNMTAVEYAYQLSNRKAVPRDRFGQFAVHLPEDKIISLLENKTGIEGRTLSSH